MQEFLISFLSEYKILAPFIFIIIRSISIIIPPIPGIVFDFIGIIAFGRILGFIYAEIGIMLGAMIAFWIARKFREPVIRRITLLRKVHEWEDTVSEKKKFWTLVTIRLPTSPIFDYVSYAAGLTKIRTSKFFLSTLIGSIPLMVLIYYFGGVSFQKGPYYATVFVIALFTLWIIFGRKSFIKRLIKTKSG